jgi:hypothetical protein
MHTEDKDKGKNVRAHAVSPIAGAQLHTLLLFALDGGDLSTSHPGRFYLQVTESRYALNKMLHRTRDKRMSHPYCG